MVDSTGMCVEDKSPVFSHAALPLEGGDYQVNIYFYRDWYDA
jgi:hypothetical protein